MTFAVPISLVSWCEHVQWQLVLAGKLLVWCAKVAQSFVPHRSFLTSPPVPWPDLCAAQVFCCIICASP